MSIHLGLPEDAAVLAAIGKIAIRHGQLEYSLKMTVRTLADVSIEDAIRATQRQGSRELRERVRRLAKQRVGEGPALVRLDAILERARKATEKRNKLLHGLWARQLDGDPVMRDDGIEFEPIPTAAQLEAVADDLAQIGKDLTFARLDGFLKEALSN